MNLYEDELNRDIEYYSKLGMIETDNISDGHHTFGELYEDRTKLFAIICNQSYPNSWKSKSHSDGTMFDGMFIAGINTKQGAYTYHCEMKYWDLFEVLTADRAPEWDGHTRLDIDRLFSLSLWLG